MNGKGGANVGSGDNDEDGIVGPGGAHYQPVADGKESAKKKGGGAAAERNDQVSMAPGSPGKSVKHPIHRWFIFLKELTFDASRRAFVFSWNFFDVYGLHVALAFLFLLSFYRATALSMLYVCVVGGLYMVRGAQGARWIWPMLVLVLWLSMVWQYVRVLGPSWKFDDTTYGWNNLSGAKQRWFILGGYTIDQLHWDFFALLCACLQLGRFSDVEYRSGRGLPAASHYVDGKGRLRTRTMRRGVDGGDYSGMGLGVGVVSSPPPAASGHPAVVPIDGDDSRNCLDKYIRGQAMRVWPAVLFVLLLLADRLLFLFVFYTGTYNADLFSIGYVIFALRFLYRVDLYRGDITAVVREWMRLHRYNLGVLCVLIAYQCPYLPRSLNNEAVLKWGNVIGLQKFWADDGSEVVSGVSTHGVLHQIVMFFIVDAMVIIFRSREYEAVRTYYGKMRHQSQLKGRVSALYRQTRRVFGLQQVFLARHKMNVKFGEVFRTIYSLNKEFFLDKQVWPQKTPNRWEEERQIEINRRREDDAALRKEMELGSSDSGAAEDVSVGSGGSGSGRQVQQPDVVIHPPYLRWIRCKLINGMDPIMWTEFKVASNDDGSDDGGNASVPVPEDVGSAVPFNEKKLRASGVVLKRRPLWNNCSTWTLAYKWALSNFEWVVYILYFINLIVNPSLLSLIIPAVILSYALVQYPRAGKGFWRLALLYTSLVVLVKFIFQLQVFCVTIIDPHYAMSPSPYCRGESIPSSGYELDDQFGMVKETKGEFFGYIFWELLCLLGIVWWRQVLVSKGLWDMSEEQLGDPLISLLWKKRLEDFERRASATPRAVVSDDDRVVSSDDDLMEDIDVGSGKRKPISAGRSDAVDVSDEEMKRQVSAGMASESGEHLSARIFVPVHVRAWQWITSTVRRVVPLSVQEYYFGVFPVRGKDMYRIKQGRRLYASIFLIELICALYILFFYSKMASTRSRSVATSLNTNLFSGYMVLTFLLQILFIIADRTIYLFRSVPAKLVLQYVAIIVWCRYIFFSWPEASLSGFSSNGALRAFFILKLLYFCTSAVQIRYGWPASEVSGFQFLTQKVTPIRKYAFKMYRALPFVFELRTLLGWMSTETSLDLWEYFKLEDLYQYLFLTQCAIKYRKTHERGAARGAFVKFYTGFLMFCLMLLVIFGPLLLFSSANPASTSNTVRGAAIELSLVGPDGEYRLLSISSTLSRSAVDVSTYVELQKRRIIDENVHLSNVQRIVMQEYADDVWEASPPSLESLQKALGDNHTRVDAKFSYSFTRLGPATAKTISGSVVHQLSLETQVRLGEVVAAAGSSGPTGNLTVLADIVPLYLRLPATSDPDIINNVRGDIALYLDSHGSGASRQVWWRMLALRTVGDGTRNKHRSHFGYDAQAEKVVEPVPITFITVSNPIFESILSSAIGGNYSIIAVYLTIVLAFGQFIRLAFGSSVEKIMYTDLHDVDTLVLWCEGIYIAREHKDLRQEEELYRLLVKVYRTPQLLIKLTERVDGDGNDADASAAVDNDDAGTDGRGGVAAASASGTGSGNAE